MKKLFIIPVMLISVSLFAQPWKSIKGDGNVKKETRQVENFTSLSSQGSIDVKINYGNSNIIQIQADENLLPYIETTVENGQLNIKTKNNVNLRSGSKMIVYVSMAKIDGLQLSGSGNIDGNGEFTGDNTTQIALSGSGNIHLSSGSFKNIEFQISGSGNINLKSGRADEITASISGSGNIDCSNLSADNVDVKISGSGNARVTANKSLTANIMGSGNVFYKGSANNISTKVAGSGKAIKI